MKTSQLATFLEIVDKKRSEIVPCLMGDPGIGKTQGIYEFAKKHDRKVVEIIASQIMPSEVSGITMPDAETKSMQVFDHARLSSLRDGDILFFDELLQAPQAVLSACLTLIQERRMMSGKTLPDIMIVAAANPLRSPTLIAESIRQRFMFINMKWDHEAWESYVEQAYGVRPTGKLVSLIESSDADSDKWNRLTPRTATKLIAWYKELMSDEELSLFRETISTMFGYGPKGTNVFEAIDRTVNGVPQTMDTDNVEIIKGMGDCFIQVLRKLAKDAGFAMVSPRNFDIFAMWLDCMQNNVNDPADGWKILSDAFYKEMFPGDNHGVEREQPTYKGSLQSMSRIINDCCKDVDYYFKANDMQDPGTFVQWITEMNRTGVSYSGQ